jgi:hypothetical protein
MAAVAPRVFCLHLPGTHGRGTVGRAADAVPPLDHVWPPSSQCRADHFQASDAPPLAAYCRAVVLKKVASSELTVLVIAALGNLRVPAANLFASPVPTHWSSSVGLHAWRSRLKCVSCGILVSYQSTLIWLGSLPIATTVPRLFGNFDFRAASGVSCTISPGLKLCTFRSADPYNEPRAGSCIILADHHTRPASSDRLVGETRTPGRRPCAECSRLMPILLAPHNGRAVRVHVHSPAASAFPAVGRNQSAASVTRITPNG